MYKNLVTAVVPTLVVACFISSTFSLPLRFTGSAA
jgi:hypothetical protein